MIGYPTRIRMNSHALTRLLMSLFVVLLGILDLSCSKQKEGAGVLSQKEALSEPFADGVFSEVVEEVILKKMELVTKTIALNPLVISTVTESNKKNKRLSLAEIKKLDADWMNAVEVNEYIQDFMNNKCAQLLLRLQETGHGFSEIFITDIKGLNVAMTNKTSDYYQADEAWWLESFDNGRGKTYHGDVEYDESAMSEAIPIFIPLKTPDLSETIGIMKVVVDITEIKMELTDN